MRARTNLSVKEKRRVELSGFRGMDFSSSPLQASSIRACDGGNWEPVNGVNRKRRGWKQVLCELPARINGIFSYTRATGEEELIVYAGVDFYRISLADLTWEAIPVKNTVGVLYWERQDRRCQAFCSEGYLYFVGCGIFFRYGEFDGAYEVRTVDPYIPITTVGIGCEESADSARETRDPVNLLTPKRRNTLFGHTRGAKWILDGAIATNSQLTVEATVLSDGKQIRRVYKNSDSADRSKLYNEEDVLAGSVSFSEGSISLLDSTVSPSGNANITVHFTAAQDLFGATGVGDISKIYGCSFGALFGVGGAEDRLFLSGNPKYPNTVFFSERQDFSYFPDQFTATLGTDGGAVKGFLPLSDSTMAIFKAHSESEGAIYYMKGEYRSFYTEEGDLKRTLPVFSVSTAGAGEPPVSPLAVANLLGESMILSRHGVYSIEYFENIVSDVRITRERSRKVSSRLCAEPNLDEAVAVVQGDRLYFSMGSHCYVTEQKYRYKENETEGVEYEWWYWDNFPARVFALVGNEVWFGTESGRICKIYDGYADCSFIQTKEGEIGFSYATGKIVPANHIVKNMGYGKPLRFLTNGIMAEIINGCISLDARKIYVLDQVLDLVYDGLPVYATSLGTSDLKEGKIYYICDTDKAAGCFSISETPTGRAKALYGLTESVRLYTEITDRIVYVGTMDISGTERCIRLTKDGPNLKIANYFRPREVGSEIRIIPTNPICRILSESPVSAYWKSPILDLGTDLYTKDLITLTLCARRLPGETVVFGYETERKKYQVTVALPNEVVLDRADFDSFSLEGGLQESILKKVREKGLQSVRFFFSSSTLAPTEVFSVGAIYRINKMKKGMM